MGDTRKHPRPITITSDRLSALWLVVGAILFLLVCQWSNPIAAWLAPIFLLRFIRTQPLVRGFPLVLLVALLASAVAIQSEMLVSGAFFYLYLIGAGLSSSLPYLADRLIAPRLAGFVASLVFPLAVTTIEYLNASFSPSGTWGSIAYTQHDDLPLIQLLSVTGIWGITFLISWFASVLNWAWERGFSWPKVRGGGLLYAGLLSLILLFGGARLAFPSSPASVVRVVGIAASSTVWSAFRQQFPDAQRQAFVSGKGTQADRERARPVFARVTDDLFQRSEQQASAGARIVLWPEDGTWVLKEDEAALIERGSQLAQRQHIYLELGMLVLLPSAEQTKFAEDKTVLIDPTGRVVWNYLKAKPVPGEGVVPGNGILPVIGTPYGQLSNAICFDLDFPGLIRQAGQAGVDIMLVPSSDWQEIDPLHTQMAGFRAVENGFTLVRQAKQGLSAVVDYEGRVLSASDYFSTDQQMLVADVPIHGVFTIYSVIGDLFAWLAVAGLLIVAALALVESRPGQREPATGVIEVVPEPEPVGRRR